MTKLIIPCVVLVRLAGTVLAQPATPASPPAAAPAAPAAADAPPAAAPPADAPSAMSTAEARKLCAAAMNADRDFAAQIVKTADEKAARQRDADTVAAHVDAYAHVQKNERHVIYGYAAMWIIAAAFVIFLWRRQQALKLEIVQLRRELDAAAVDARPAGKA